MNTHHPLRYTLLASLVTSTLLLAACNSDDSDSNTSKPAPGSRLPAPILPQPRPSSCRRTSF